MATIRRYLNWPHQVRMNLLERLLDRANGLMAETGMSMLGDLTYLTLPGDIQALWYSHI